MSRWKISSQEIVLAGRRLPVDARGVTLGRWRIPVTRDQVMMLMVALNLAFLGLDIYLAHVMNGTLRPNEIIPIVFGPVAAVLLLIAGVISLRRRTTAILIAFGVLAVSLLVGLVGAYFHVARAIPPSGLHQSLNISTNFFIFAPPVIGPLTFSLMAVIGVIAAIQEKPTDSGRMSVPGLFSWRTPFSVTRQYYIWIGLGILSTVLSSVLDHGRFNFENPWVWLPTIIGVFAVVATIAMGLIEEPSQGDTITYAIAMIALILVGIIGLVLHVETDLATRNEIVIERFLRGAPFLAPMLFADMGALGLIVLWPHKTEDAETTDTNVSA